MPARDRATVRETSWVVGETSFATATGLARLVTTARPSSSRRPASRPKAAGSSSWSGGSVGERLHRWLIRLEPETPSTVAWCIFENTTTRSASPSPRNPSITHISHSGRERSNGSPARCAVSEVSSS